MRKQKFNAKSVELAFDRDAAVRSRIFYGLAAGTVLIGLIGGWAAHAELSGAVIAVGQVKVDKDLRAIQHLDGGIVREIAVQKGDVVDQGQLLLRLDDTQIRSEQKIIRNQLQELMARHARLVAERDGAQTLDVPRDEIGLNVGDTLAFRGEVRLFDGNAATRRSKKEQLELGIAQLDQEIVGMKAQQEANASEKGIVEAELAKLTPLREQGLIDNSRILNNTRDLVKLSGDQGSIASNIAKALSRKSEMLVNLAAIDADARTEAQKQLSDVAPRINDLLQRHAAVVDKLERTEIRSPMDGVINEIAVNTIGGVITPAQKLLTVVPQGAKLQVEVRLLPSDIDQVFVGQDARVRFSSFTSRTTPELNGSIVFISPATATDEASGQVYYVGQVEVPHTEMAKLNGKKLIPGMPVESYMQTESRSALSYFVKPFADQFAKAFREQ